MADDSALFPEDPITQGALDPLSYIPQGIKDDIRAGYLGQKSNIQGALGGLSQAAGLPYARDQFLQDSADSAFAASQATGTPQDRRMASIDPNAKPQDDVTGATGALDFVKRAGNALAESSPQVAATLGAAGAGAAAGEALFPPGGGIPGALLAAGAVNLPGRMGQNIREQLNTGAQPDQLQPGRAAAAAVPMAALDSLLTVLMPGGLAKPLSGGVLSRAAQGAIEQAILNASTSTLQEATSIFQANPDLQNLFTPDSLKRIGDVAANATAAAAPLGAFGRVAQGRAPKGDGTPSNPVQVRDNGDLQAARDRVDTDPTDLQKETGRYQKGFINLDGLDIAIENPQGSIRSGVDPNGKEWSSHMPADYGEIPKTQGSDGDPVDAYVGPNVKSKKVFVIDQVDPETGFHDEHKAMIGFPTQEAALNTYDQAFADGSAMSRIGGVREMPFDTFKLWAKEGDTSSAVSGQELPKTQSDVKHLADSKGITWDSDPVFMSTAKKLTGQEHLEDMNIPQLQKMYDALDAVGKPPEVANLGTAKEATVPENRATMLEQQRALTEGRRPVQMFPNGTPTLPLPDGMKALETPRGVFHYDPKQTNANEIQTASALGRENEILGLGPLSKKQVMESGEPPMAVVERTPQGTEVVSALTTPSRATETMAAVKAQADPAHTVSIERPQGVVNGREASPQYTAQLPATQGVPDVPSVAQTPKDPFYSAVTRTVENSPRNEASAQAWKNVIQKGENVKADETYWSGLDDFLEANKGRSIKKQEILDHLDQNGVKINEIMKSNTPVNPKVRAERPGYEYSQGEFETEEPDESYLSERAGERFDDEFSGKYSDPVSLRELGHVDKALGKFADDWIGDRDQNNIDHGKITDFLTRMVDEGAVHPTVANHVMDGMRNGHIENKAWEALSTEVKDAMIDHLENGPPERDDRQHELPIDGHVNDDRTSTEERLQPFEDAVRELHGFQTAKIPLKGEAASVPEGQRAAFRQRRGEMPDVEKTIKDHLWEKMEEGYTDQERSWYMDDSDSPRVRKDTITVDGTEHHYTITHSYGEWQVFDHTTGEDIDLPRRPDEANIRQAIESHAMENNDYRPDGYEDDEEEPEEDGDAPSSPGVRPGQSYGGPTKWGDYTFQKGMNGGKNYRELLLTLPKDQKIAQIQARRDALSRAPLGDTLPDGRTVQHHIDGLDQMYADALEGRYKSAHWSEPDVFAHIRMNDQTGPAGEKILHIEEMQSDLHQQGRDEGYKTPEIKRQIEKLNNRQQEIAEAKAKLAKDRDPVSNVMRDEPRFHELSRESDALYRESAKFNNMVPDAPFKENYRTLMFKRALREAVEGGYDKMTWTTGDQQNDRWSSSVRQSLHRVNWSDSVSGVGTDVKYEGPQGSGTLRIDSDGRVIEAPHSELEGKKLSTVFGKKIAEKILASDSGHLSGDGLEIGKEGFRDSYDVAAVNTAKKIATKFGSKVGMIDMPIGPKQGGGNSVAQAQANSSIPTKTVHSIDITPQMRDSLMQGQPMFTAQPKNLGEARQAVMDDVTNVIRQVTDGRAKVNFKDKITAYGPRLAESGGGTAMREVAGSYNPLDSLITASLAPQWDATTAAAHESWHWVKQNGLFTDREKAALRNGSETLGRMVKAEGLDPTSMSTEEIEAHAFGRWWRLHREGQNPYGVTPPLRAVFNRAIRFFGEIAARVKNYGFITPHQVFRRAAAGQMAQRTSPNSAPGAARSPLTMRFGTPAAVSFPAAGASQQNQGAL